MSSAREAASKHPTAGSVDARPRLATWRDVFADAVAAGDHDQAAAVLEEHLLTLLGRGDDRTIAALIAQLPVSARTPLLRAAEADAATRAHTVDLASLDALERSVQSSIDLRAYVVSVKAQYLLWRGDPLCFGVAQTGLDLLPQEGLMSPVGLFARGRLRLVLAIGTLFVSFAERPAAEALLDAAVADFMRCGAVEEAAAAQAYLYGLAAAVTWTDVVEAAEIVGAAAARLRTRGSGYAPFAFVSEALLRVIAGDLWSAHRALEEFDAWDGPVPDFVPYIAQYVRLMIRMITYGADESFDADAERITDGLDRHAPELAGTMTLTIAGVLADRRDYVRARRWNARARQAPVPLPADPLGRQLLDARLLVVAGQTDDGVAKGLDAVEGVRDAGYGRAAEIALARIARSLTDAGEHARAAEVRRAAADALGRPQSVWEALLLGPDARAEPVPPPAAIPPTVRICALAPDVAVEIDGRRSPLGRLHPRIVGFLLATNRPCTLDEVLDAVWPDIEPSAARHRLAMALHRLRATTPAGVDLVVREPAGLRIAGVADGCTSDVAELLAVDPNDPRRAADAVLRYDADFAERQLAYDEWAVDARRWLRARFVLLATRALEHALATEGDARSGDSNDSGGSRDSVEVAIRARFAAEDDPALAAAVVAVLQRAGRGAEAGAVLDAVEAAGVLSATELATLRAIPM